MVNFLLPIVGSARNTEYKNLGYVAYVIDQVSLMETSMIISSSSTWDTVEP